MRTLLTTALALVIAACAGGGSYNTTTVVAQMDPSLPDREQFSTFIIATTNLGKPSRNYLAEHEARIDAMLTDYLQEHGHRVVASARFEEAFQEGVRKYGSPFDETTGRVNERSFVAALNVAANALKEDGEVDAIIFTDLLESQVFFSTGINRVARFDGVTRKPSMQGPGEGVPADFNWVQEVDAVSLHVNIYSLDLQRLFNGAGGIELTEAIDTRGGSARFKRRRTVLGNDGNIEEGIQLALHPFIAMKNWPGKQN